MLKKDANLKEDYTAATNKIVGDWTVETVELDIYGHGPPKRFIKDEQGRWTETVWVKDWKEEDD